MQGFLLPCLHLCVPCSLCHSTSRPSHSQMKVFKHGFFLLCVIVDYCLVCGLLDVIRSKVNQDSYCLALHIKASRSLRLAEANLHVILEVARLS